MEIHLFQLENLFLSPSRFLFFDLNGEESLSIPPELQNVLNKAEKISEADVVLRLRERKVERDFPIVFICDRGAVSSRTAKNLEAEGFTNVYIVAGGLEGLRSEL